MTVPSALPTRESREQHLLAARMIVMGDSHAQFWSGQDAHNAGEIIPGIAVLGVPAGLAHNLVNPDSTSGARSRLFHLLKVIERKRQPPEFLMFSFGEIDIRMHVIKQAVIQRVSIATVVRGVVENYLQFLREMLDRGSRILVWGPPASMRETISYQYQENYSFIGSEFERNQATALFHQMMESAAAESEGRITFLGILPDLLTARGLTRSGVHHDGVHLAQAVMPMALDHLEAATGWRPEWQRPSCPPQIDPRVYEPLPAIDVTPPEEQSWSPPDPRYVRLFSNLRVIDEVRLVLPPGTDADAAQGIVAETSLNHVDYTPLVDGRFGIDEHGPNISYPVPHLPLRSVRVAKAGDPAFAPKRVMIFARGLR